MATGDVLTVVDANHATFLPLGSDDVLTVVDATHAAFLPPGSDDVLTEVDGSHATFQAPVPSFSPLDIAGWSAIYLPDAVGNSVSQWSDASGNGLHATQTVAGNRYVLNTGAGINSRSSYVSPLIGAFPFWDLPAGLSVDLQAHSWYFMGRSRSMANGTSRCPISFGAGLVDGMTEFTTTTGTQMRLRTWPGNMAAPIWGRSGLTVMIVTATASAVTIRVNGEVASLSAYSAGTLTGGYLGTREDTQQWAGELYEFGVLPRAFSAGEITQMEDYAVSYYGRPLSATKEIVIAGDSLTEGRTATNQRGWPWLLDNSLGATWQQLSMGRDGAYLGASGTTLVTEATDLAATYRAGKSKHVAIMAGGTNDLGAGAASAATVLGYAQSWASTMKGAGWYVVLCTVAKRDDAAWSGTKETQRLAYNTGLSGLSDVDAVVDIAGLTELSNPSNATYFDADKLHWLEPAFVAVEALIRTAVIAA